MVDYITIIVSIISSIIVSVLTVILTHKWNIKYFKKEFVFKRQMELFEGLSQLFWENQVVLISLDSPNIKKEEIEVLRNKLKSDLEKAKSFFRILLYVPLNFTQKMGSYIRLLEDYMMNDKFGKKELNDKIREDRKIIMPEIQKLMQEEIDKIK